MRTLKPILALQKQNSFLMYYLMTELIASVCLSRKYSLGNMVCAIKI